jgi:glycerol-3-phosphate acyltransferase PlsY
MMGVSLGLAWPIAVAYAVTWLGMLAATRISSLGGMSAALIAPVAALATGNAQFAPALAAIAALVLFMHRTNITRLRAGTEPRIGGSKNR